MYPSHDSSDAREYLFDKYNFLLPDLGEGDIRQLRDPGATDEPPG